MPDVKFVDLPLQFASLKAEVLAELASVCETGDFVLGAKLKEFEENFARYCGSTYAIGVANGTDALFLIMKALGIGQGDEVITAPNSFLATAGAIVATGARPVFVDVRDDFNINPALLANAITPKTKAIIPVHLTGRPADMHPLLDIANSHGLHVIEDAAQATGAKYQGKKVGSFGIAAAFSLHPLKTLNAYGDGGIITTNDQSIYEKLIKLRNHGLKNRDECEMWGYNSRLDCMQAAILNVKLRHLDTWNERVREIADRYRKGLSDVVSVQIDKPHEYAVYHTFIIQCARRDDLQAYLSRKGIQTKIHYPIPIHLQEAASTLGYKEGDFPIVEQQTKHILSLPIYSELTDEKIDAIIQEIRDFDHTQRAS